MILRRTIIFIILLLLLAAVPGCEFLEWLAEEEELDTGYVQLEVISSELVQVSSEGPDFLSQATGTVVNNGTRTAFDVTVHVNYYALADVLIDFDSVWVGDLAPGATATFTTDALLTPSAIARVAFSFSYE